MSDELIADLQRIEASTYTDEEQERRNKKPEHQAETAPGDDGYSDGLPVVEVQASDLRQYMRLTAYRRYLVEQGHEPHVLTGFRSGAQRRSFKLVWEAVRQCSSANIEHVGEGANHRKTWVDMNTIQPCRLVIVE